MSKIARSSLIVTVFTLLGLGLSFLSNVVIAANFGAGADMDVFLAATTVPLFITTILSGSLNYTFIPVFAEYREKEPGEIWKVVGSFLNLSVLAGAAAACAGILAAGPIMRLVTPGFSPENLARSAGLLRWLFPTIVFTLINELLASIYYSNQKFTIPSLNKVIAPVLTIAYVTAFHDTLNTKSIALAMLTASFLQAAVLAAGFLRNKEFHYVPALDIRHPGVAKILALMLPLVLGMLVCKAVPLTDAYFLSSLPSGSISHINYASRLIGVILMVTVSGLTVSTFPVMSRYAAENNGTAFKELLVKGARMLFFFSAPFVVLLALYGRPVVQLIFERGAFLRTDTAAVFAALALYLLSLPANALGTLVSQAFYARQEARLISLISVTLAAVYIALCVPSVRAFGYLGIPAAYALYNNLAILTTFTVIRRKLPGSWPPILAPFLKSALAALGAAALLYPLYRLSGESALARTGLCAAGFAAYFVIGKVLFRLEEADSLLRLLREQAARITA